MKESFAAFAAPILTAFVLLYQAYAPLQIAILSRESIFVLGSVLAIAAAAGVVAACGAPVLRAAVLALCATVLVDVTVPLAGLFERIRPEVRGRVERDRQRIADISTLKAALDGYAAVVGPLPAPLEYGEGIGADDFWKGWWDGSATDVDGDGGPFLEFLSDSGQLTDVPLDPLNEAGDGVDARSGQQYVYYVVPPGHSYRGGTCEDDASRGVYMLAITNLETEDARPPANTQGSGCSCLWRDAPDFFQQHFDYVVCGTYGR